MFRENFSESVNGRLLKYDDEYLTIDDDEKSEDDLIIKIVEDQMFIVNDIDITIYM